ASVTTIKGAPAARMMRALAPLMSARRRSQIERALRDHRPRERWQLPRTVCIGANCLRPAKARGLCKQHYQQWWKSNRRGPTRQFSPIAEELITDGSEFSWEAADTEARVAWLAGVMEGEGSFLSARFDGHSYPRVQMTMCDKDVLERAMTLMPASHMYAINDKRGIERGWSEAWMVRVNGRPAAAVMTAVLPWMGSRRTRAIDRALSAWRPIRTAPSRSSCIVPGCWRRHAA